MCLIKLEKAFDDRIDFFVQEIIVIDVSVTQEIGKIELNYKVNLKIWNN